MIKLGSILVMKYHLNSVSSALRTDGTTLDIYFSESLDVPNIIEDIVFR